MLILHSKWRETRQQPIRSTSCHNPSFYLISSATRYYSASTLFWMFGLEETLLLKPSLLISNVVCVGVISCRVASHAVQLLHSRQLLLQQKINRKLQPHNQYKPSTSLTHTNCCFSVPESYSPETHYLDGVHQLGLIMLIKVPDDAPALLEKRAAEVLQGGVVVVLLLCERFESGRKEVDTKDPWNQEMTLSKPLEKNGTQSVLMVSKDTINQRLTANQLMEKPLSCNH